MCYAVKCSSCGKTTWGGCGRHVASVYKQVPDGQRCECREWPGVTPGAAADDVAASSSSSCAIL